MKIKPHLILVAVCLLAVYWIWWLPGPRVATDFSLISQESLKKLMDFPQTWSIKGTEGLGEYTVFTLWSWPFSFLMGLLANLKISFSVLERVLMIVPFLLIGTLGIWRLGQHIKLSDNAKFISSLLYLTNTYILLVIDGGQLTIALAYAFFPIAYLAVEKSIQGSYKQKILAGIFVSVVGFFDIRFVYILFLLSFVRFLYEFLFLTSKKRIWWILSWVKTGAVLTLIVVGLNFYWFLLLLKAPFSSSTYTSLTQTSFVSFISLGHAILMLSPHWFKNVFGQVTDLKFEFMLIPILVFLAPILKPKNRLVGFWLLVAILAIFITKGSAEPFSKFYPWLYFNIPGFSLFRDSSKFFFLIALSYTVLIGITVNEILKRVSSAKIKTAFVITLIIYLLFLIRPVFLGWMTGTFSQPPLKNEYSKLTSLLKEDQVFSNVFWIPTILPLTSLNSDHPSLEASRLAQKRPFAVGIVGAYETFNFLREAPYMGQLFDVANIGYVIYPYLDPRRDNLHPDNIKYYYTFLDQLSKKDWLYRVIDSPVPTLKTKQHQDRFFVTSNVWWVIGSDDIYYEATNSSQLKLSKNALIFVEEYQGLGARIDELPEARIILNKKTSVDLAASFIKISNLIFPAKNLNFEPDKSEWWKREAKDLIRWRDFLQTKYGIDNKDFDLGGGWAVGEGNIKYQISNIKYQKDSVLLARVMESSRSGSLKFYQSSQEMGEVSTKINGDANIRWFEMGQLSQDGGEIEIVSSGDINVVNALAVVDESEWIKYKKIAKEYQDQGRVVEFEEKNTQEGQGSVTYQKINPTKYLIRISGLIKPAFLVFSQNYDYFWKRNGQSPLPVYSLLNGFRISANGDYIVEFEPQKYVYTGLIISGLTLLVLVFLLIKSSKSY